MSRMKFILLGLLAAFAVSAAAASSASAEACHEQAGPEVTMCVENVEFGSPTTASETFSAKIKPTTVSILKIPGVITITCKKASTPAMGSLGEFVVQDSLNPGVSDLRLEFSECTTTVAPHCVATEPIVANGGTLGDNLDGVVESIEKVKFSPSEGTVFATVNLKSVGGTCAFVGNNNVSTKNKVAGEGPECNLPNIKVENKEHEVVCEAAKSNLEFLGNAAEFSIEEVVELSGAKVGQKFRFAEDKAG